MRQLQLPEFVPGGIEVWRVALETSREPDAEAWGVLSREERKRARRFRNMADRVRAVTTRAALRRLLAHRLGMAPEVPRFVEGPYGKPSLPEGGGLEFNVSHAGDIALIALAPGGAVGVDVELRYPDAELAALLDHFLSPRERAEHESGQAVLPLIERWVAKEAALKALGVGIGECLKTISILGKTGDSRGRYRLRHARPEWPELNAWPLEAPKGYVAALAVAGSASKTVSVVTEKNGVCNDRS
ncbi:4'-phosphopantetheinyl transferase family protein [Halomonas elongata]|uniref:4'-phosphopantetheinyl transferase family protein n=1 Tax=Halomonas elongata TaxID=2746 RepID=UPI0038D434C3